MSNGARRYKSQLPRPVERDGLVSVLYLNSVPQRRVQLQLQRTTHHGSVATPPGTPTRCPSLPTVAEPLASKERYARPGIFYPNTVSCSEPTEYSTVKEPVGEPSLSSGEECLSLRRNYSTLQHGCQYGSIVA